MHRSSIIQFTIIFSLFCGLGIWHFHSSKNIDDDDSANEIDGFESAAPFTRITESQVATGIQFGDAIPLVAAPELKSSVPDPNDGPDDETAQSSDVWLTGTIEDVEPKDRIKIPTRISGGPIDAPTLR